MTKFNKIPVDALKISFWNGLLTPSWIKRKKARKHIKEGNTERNAHLWREAAIHYRNALQYVPNRDDIWVQYGHALKESRLLTDAELAYRNALLINSHNADTYLQLGHVLKMQGQYNEARTAYLDAYDIDPRCPGLASEL